MHRDYIVTYDICDKKRLAKLARFLEKIAMRVQYSVFLLSSVTKYELLVIIENIKKIIDSDADDVRIYKIIDTGIALGKAVKLDEPFIFW
jgi:CRISPR-associated protein Cas2